MLEKEQLKEQRKHGTVFFPYASYRWDETSKSGSFIHWHEETEVELLEPLVKGKMEIPMVVRGIDVNKKSSQL